MNGLIERIESPGWQRPDAVGLPSAWDVAVVGAGPSGSLAACRLASLGHRVLLLDAASFPREKTCGDALIPDALNALDRFGLLERVKSVGHHLSAASVFSPAQIEVAVPGEYVTLKRRTLDAVLAMAAVERGATFCRAAVEQVTVTGEDTAAFRIQGVSVPFSARVLVLATGGNTRLLGQLGMLRRPEPSAMAVRCYITSPHQIERLVVSYDRSITPGYAWIFPLGGGEYNIGCGVFYRKPRHRKINLRQMFNSFVSEFPLARHLMESSTGMTPLKGAPLRCNLTGTRVLGKGRIVAVGEAIGATFPLTGEGIGKAMETAELAADAVDQMLRTGSDRQLRILPWRIRTELLPRYLGYEIGERWLSYPWLNDLVASRIARSAFLQKVVSGVISETVDPRKLFSIGSLLKSLWR